MIWLCAALALAVLVLSMKLYTTRKAAREIREGLSEKLEVDTNTLLSVSTGDTEMRALAADLNRQLRILRCQRQKYLHGDRELKEAVTNISHDLRTPLTAICGYLELLKGEEMSENAFRYLGFIENRTEALKGLTEELFRYSVITSTPDDLELETVHVNEVLEESIAALYAALHQRGISPVIHMPETKVLRRLNRAALSRVFSNILNNVLKYSDGDLEILLTEEGDITFTNTAPTLDEVQVGRLFDRFFSVEAARNSTGLGLSIARHLMEQMQGSISAAYEDEKFQITLRLPE